MNVVAVSTTTKTTEITVTVACERGVLLAMYNRLLFARAEEDGPLMGLVSGAEIPIAIAAIKHYGECNCIVTQRGDNLFLIESLGAKLTPNL